MYLQGRLEEALALADDAFVGGPPDSLLVQIAEHPLASKGASGGAASDIMGQPSVGDALVGAGFVAALILGIPIVAVGAIAAASKIAHRFEWRRFASAVGLQIARGRGTSNTALCIYSKHPQGNCLGLARSRAWSALLKVVSPASAAMHSQSAEPASSLAESRF